MSKDRQVIPASFDDEARRSPEMALAAAQEHLVYLPARDSVEAINASSIAHALHSSRWRSTDFIAESTANWGCCRTVMRSCSIPLTVTNFVRATVAWTKPFCVTGSSQVGYSWSWSWRRWMWSPIAVGGNWAWSLMESSGKGRRYHTFAHTEYASVAIFNLSKHTNQNIESICYVYKWRYIHRYGYTHIQTHSYMPHHTNNKWKLYWNKQKYNRVAERSTSQYI